MNEYDRFTAAMNKLDSHGVDCSAWLTFGYIEPNMKVAMSLEDFERLVNRIASRPAVRTTGPFNREQKTK